MQDKSERRTQENRSLAMRARLLNAARGLFAEKGFAETATPEIVAQAGVTRGALYHHFAEKTELFRAVVEAEAQAAAQAAAVPAGGDALERGAEAWFQAMAVPGRARLLLVDGPAVLGPEAMAAIEARAGGAELRAGLAERIGLPPGPLLDALTEVLSAAFDRAALAIAAGGETKVYLEAILRLIGGKP